MLVCFPPFHRKCLSSFPISWTIESGANEMEQMKIGNAASIGFMRVNFPFDLSQIDPREGIFFLIFSTIYFQYEILFFPLWNRIPRYLKEFQFIQPSYPSSLDILAISLEGQFFIPQNGTSLPVTTFPWFCCMSKLPWRHFMKVTEKTSNLEDPYMEFRNSVDLFSTPLERYFS